jgi:hypothetical protein
MANASIVGAICFGRTGFEDGDLDTARTSGVLKCRRLRRWGEGWVRKECETPPPQARTALGGPVADGWGEWIFRLEPLIVRPERYGEPSRFDTTPSQPNVQACSLINIGVILLLLLFDDQTTKIAAPPVAPRA